MSVARIALVLLAVAAIAGGLLMLIAGDVVRGVPVLAASAGPLWLQRHLGRQDATGAR